MKGNHLIIGLVVVAILFYLYKKGYFGGTATA